MQQVTKDNEQGDSSIVLTEREIERLLVENTPEVRIDVIDKITHAHAARKYSLHDVAIAEQIMRILVKDTEISVRENLAIRLRDNPYVPVDIIMTLANDVDMIASTVLEHSPVLSDSDLISVVNSCKSIRKQSAVAKRNPVSEALSRALVATHIPEVVSKLTRNLNANIPVEAYQEIIRDHAKNQEIMHAVSERPNLPVTVVEKVITLVSESVASSLQKKYNISQTVIEAETEKTREIATLSLVDGEHNKYDIEKLVDQLRSFNRLTPSIILTSLCRGNLYFFETSLARLSSIPIHNAQLLIHDKGGLGFKALYTKAALPEKFFDACRLLLEVVAETKRKRSILTGAASANQIVQTLLAKAAGKDIENLSYIVALIRQVS
jgi:uncharacterized protein (DUF2336 family)